MVLFVKNYKLNVSERFCEYAFLIKIYYSEFKIEINFSNSHCLVVSVVFFCLLFCLFQDAGRLDALLQGRGTSI